MKGKVLEARARLRVLGRRRRAKCQECETSPIAWDRVPADAPVKCGRCCRALDYIVYRWKDASDENSGATTDFDGSR